MMSVTVVLMSLPGGRVRLRKSVISWRSWSAADLPMNRSSEPSSEANASTAGNTLTMAQNDRPAATSFRPCVLLRSWISFRTARTAPPRPLRSGVVNRGVGPQLVEAVTGVDEPHRARLRPHHQRLCGGAAVVEVDTAQQLAVGDTGGGEEAVVTLDEVVGGEHPVEVVASGDGGRPLAVVARPQAPLDLPAHALEGSGGDHAFGSAADAEQDVGTGVGPGGGDGAVDVAVGDEPHPRPGRPDLGDEVLVALAIEDHDGEVAHALTLGLGHRLQVFGDRCRDVDGAGGVRADGDLLHVEARARVEHGAPLAHGDDGEGV